MNNKMIDSLIKKNAKDRYEYAIKRIADDEQAFGLFNDGWALYQDDEGKSFFPLWSDKEFAELCKTEEYKDFEIVEISIEELFELFNSFEVDNINIVVFPLSDDNGICIESSILKNHLEVELSKY